MVTDFGEYLVGEVSRLWGANDAKGEVVGGEVAEGVDEGRNVFVGADEPRKEYATWDGTFLWVAGEPVPVVSVQDDGAHVVAVDAARADRV